MSKKVLIVDDSPTVRSLHSYILKNQGFEIETASNGVEALEKIYATPMSAVVVDINMPKMDGIEFVKVLRKDEHYRDLPVIIVSSEGEEADVKKGIDAGANIYMLKPAKPEQMVLYVQMLLGA